MKEGSGRRISADQGRKSRVSCGLSAADWLILQDPMAPHWWSLWTYIEDRDEWWRAGPAERQSSEVKRWGGQKPKDGNHLVGGRARV